MYAKNYDRIFEDPFGNIWAQTSWGMNVFDPETESFSTTPEAILKKLGLPTKEVLFIQKDREGNFWFVLEQEKIYKYSPENQAIDSVNSSVSKSGNSVTDVQEGSNQSLWLAYENGVIKKLDKKSLEITGEFKALTVRFNNPKNYKLAVDCENQLWVHLFEDHGLFYYQPEKDSLQNFTTESSQLKLSSNLISDVVLDTENNIWVATDHGGITVINQERQETTYISNNPEIENSLSHNSITSLYKDEDGIIWAGTFKSGVDYFHKNTVRFQHYENLFSQDNSLPFNDVNVFEEDKEGNIWIGTNGGGLIHFNRETGEYRQFKNEPGNPNSISSNIIVSLLFDSRGDLWIGTYLGGLNQLEKTGNQYSFKRFEHDPQDLFSLTGNSVWELFEDSRGTLWVGTLESGLAIFDRNEEKFYHHNTSEKIPDLQNTNYIAGITEDINGNIWVGGVNGIDTFNPESGETKHFSASEDEESSLPTDYIISLFSDSEGYIWAGTEKGLSLYNADTDSFQNFAKENGLPGKNVLAITEDDLGDLWLSSSYGLFQMHKNLEEDTEELQLSFRKYDDEDGLQGKLFNQNALFKTSDGELVAGGLNGFNIFNPKNINFNEDPPRVVFTSLQLFNQPVTTGEEINNRVILEEAINETSSITLKHKENLFSLEFAALDFFQPSKNNYQYKLEGFDSEWQETGSDNRRVTYTNLDPGEYTFMVKASNNDQVWSNEPASIQIEVLPPFYRTAYAYVLYVLLIIGILVYSRHRIIKRQKEKFQVEQEKREAAQLHKMDLMKIRFFTNISHEFKTPLSLILAVIEKLKSKETVSEKQQHLETINKNTQRLFNLINQILDLRNIKKETLLSTSKDNLIAFIERTFTSFNSLAAKKKINYSLKTDTDYFYTAFDKDKLEKILFNLLSNAFKFTPTGGEIIVDCKVLSTQNKEKKTVKISVADSGIGISKEDQKHIFDRFYKAETTGENAASGSGIGLSLVKEYIDLYKGKIEVASSPNRGTTFSVFIPLPKLEAPQKNEEKTEKPEKINPLQEESLPSVLIIEDNVDFLNYLTEEFKENYNVFIAENGNEGWKKTLSIKPDLIISDWMMPEMDGVALCEKIRNDTRTKHIPFILLTANKKDEEKLKALKTGVNDYISKPFNLEVLKSRAENLIKQRRDFQQAYSKKIKLEKEQQPVVSQDEKFIRSAIKIVDENISDSNFSVESLATQLGVSRTYLYNKIRTKTEKSPQAFIRDSRLERGKYLLEKSQMTIAEIAFEVGFNNPKYFSRNFKKKYQVLPSTHREKYKV